MSQKTYCLILGASEPWRERSIVAAAKSTHLPIAIVVKSNDLRCTDFADIVIIADESNPFETLKSIQEYEIIHGIKPEVIIPVFELGLTTGIEISKYYNLNFHSEETIIKARNKAKMKRLFFDNGINSSKFVEIFKVNDESEQEIISYLKFPVIIKPSNLGGSFGVKLCNTPAMLKSKLQETKKEIKQFSIKYSIDFESIIVEEYIDSSIEVSVEVLNTSTSNYALAVVDKVVTPPPKFIEIGHMYPSIYSERDDIKQLAINACKSIGLKHGVSHVEIKLDKFDQPSVIEVNARAAGDNIPNIIYKSSGIDIYKLNSDSFTSLPIVEPLLSKSLKVNAIFYIKADVGKIVDISNVDELNLPNWVNKVHILKGIGSYSEDFKDSFSRDAAIECEWGLEERKKHAALDLSKKLSYLLFKTDARSVY